MADVSIPFVDTPSPTAAASSSSAPAASSSSVAAASSSSAVADASAPAAEQPETLIDLLPAALLSKINEYLPLSGKLLLSMASPCFKDVMERETEIPPDVMNAARQSLLEVERYESSLTRKPGAGKSSIYLNTVAELDLVPALIRTGAVCLYSQLNDMLKGEVSSLVHQRKGQLKNPKPDFVKVSAEHISEIIDAFSVNWAQRAPQLTPEFVRTKLSEIANTIISSAQGKGSKYGPGVIAVANLDALPPQLETRAIIQEINSQLHAKGPRGALVATLLVFRGGHLERVRPSSPSGPS